MNRPLQHATIAGDAKDPMEQLATIASRAATPLSIISAKGLKGTILVNGSFGLGYLTAALMLAEGPLVLPLVAFLSGVLWWSFLEYHLHRFVLHWEPKQAVRKRLRGFFPAHRGHHNTPGDPDRIVNRRFALTVGLSLFQIAVMSLIGFSASWTLAMTGGTLIGHLFYEYLHVATHTLPTRNAFIRLIKQHHLFHHYRDESVNFGVTSPIWDYVFFTAYRPRSRHAR